MVDVNGTRIVDLDFLGMHDPDDDLGTPLLHPTITIQDIPADVLEAEDDVTDVIADGLQQALTGTLDTSVQTLGNGLVGAAGDALVNQNPIVTPVTTAANDTTATATGTVATVIEATQAAGPTLDAIPLAVGDTVSQSSIVPTDTALNQTITPVVAPVDRRPHHRHHPRHTASPSPPSNRPPRRCWHRSPRSSTRPTPPAAAPPRAPPPRPNPCRRWLPSSQPSHPSAPS